jgi:hypothetical protein
MKKTRLVQIIIILAMLLIFALPAYGLSGWVG